MSWDAFQREVLAELGHVLYRPLGVDADADPAAGPAAVRADPDPAMLARLAKAAATDAELLARDAGIVAASAGLRGNAAAKRALWPRLRALRRQRG